MSAILFDALGLAILHFLWQGALVGLAAALVLRSLRQAAPAYRHAVAWLALLACLAWPAAQLAQRAAAAMAGPEAVEVYKSGLPGNDVLPGVSAGDLAGRHGNLLVAAWAAGVLLLTLRSGAGLAWIRRHARGPAAPAWEQRCAHLAVRLGIGQPVAVRLLAGLDSPVTAGWRHPLILLPAALTASLPAGQIDALLAHELAHVRRRDYLANLVQTLVTTLLFFHPVAWWLSQRIDAERELLADALAAQVLDDARSLAQALAELDRQRHAGSHLAQAASGGELLARVRALVAPQAVAFKPGIVVPAAVAALVGVALAAQAAGKATGQTLTRRATVDFRSCAKPHYPAAALAAEQTGTVTLRFQVARDGAVTSGQVTRSSGHDSLDQAALQGISLCRFQPAQIDGMPVATSQQMQYVWVLE